MDPRITGQKPGVSNNQPPKIEPAKANTGWFSWASQATNAAYSLTKVVTSKTSDKQEVIDNARNTILTSLSKNDAAMFLQLLDLVNAGVAKTTDNLSGVTGWIGRRLDAGILTKAVISQAFANLAGKLQENSESIPNYHKQPALASLISLLVKEAGSSLSNERLDAIAKQHDYQGKMKAIQELNRKHYSPDYANGLILEYLESPATKTHLKNHLFEQFTYEEKQEYLVHLNKLQACNEELKVPFKEAAANMIRYIFPEGVKDPALSKFLEGEDLFNTICGSIESRIAEALFTEYQPIKANSLFTDESKESIEKAVGANIDSVIEAPAKLVGGIASHVLQFNPSILGAITTNLQAMAYTTPENPTEMEKKQALYQEMEFKNLGTWILDSFRAVAKTDDKELEGLLGFGSSILTTFTENLLGKGLALLPEKSEKRGESQLFNEIADGVKTAANSGNIGAKIADFVSTLPLPTTLRKTMLSTIQQSTNINFELLTKQAEKLHQESKAKLEGLPFAIIQSISGQLATSIANKGSDWLAGAGSSATLQDLLDEFLPGLTLDPALKTSFKANFDAFKEVQVSPESIKLLSQNIEIVLMQAMLGTIAEDFNPKISVKDQFLARLNAVFSKKFGALTDEERLKVRSALAIQAKIDGITDRKKSILRSLAEQGTLSLNPSLQKAFDKAKLNQNRIRNAFLARNNLMKTLDEKLLQIGPKWTFETIKKLSENLKGEENLLSGLSSESLKEVSSALDILAAIESAEMERQDRVKESKKAFQEFQTYLSDPGFQGANLWIENYFKYLDELDGLNVAISSLELQQKKSMPFFEELSQELSVVLGLGDKDKIKLPTALLNKIWPFIEDAKTNQGAKILFDFAAPVWLAIADKEMHKQSLLQNKKNEALIKLVESATKSTLKGIPALIQNNETAKSFANSLESALPGIIKYEGNITNELKSLVTGDQSFLALNESFLENYIQGLIFKYFDLIPKEKGDILTAITKNLEELLQATNEANQLEDSHLNSKILDNNIDNAIEAILSNHLQIKSEHDLNDIPAPLRGLIYGKLRDGIKEVLIPILLPDIENNQALKEALPHVSGSPFLGSLAEALSDDLLNQLPAAIQNLSGSAKALFKKLSGKEPSEKELNLLISLLTELRKEGRVTNTTLLASYVKATGGGFTEIQLEALKKELKKDPSIKGNITSILMTPEEIVAAIDKQLELTPDLKELVTVEVENFISTGKISYVAKTVIQHHLIKFFHAFASVNKASGGKDSFSIFIDKLMNILGEKFASGKPADQIGKELEEELLKPDNLGIVEGLNKLPEFLRTPIFAAIRGKLEQALADVQKTPLLAGKVEAKGPHAALTNQLAQYIGDLAAAGLPGLVGAKTEIVTPLPSLIEWQLESLAATNTKLTTTLLEYLPGLNIDQKAGALLEGAADLPTEKAALLVNNLLAEPLNAVVTRAINLEDKYKEKLDEKIATNLLNVIAGHLEIFGRAEKTGPISHEAYLAAAGKEIHPAVPLKDIDFSGALQAIETKIPEIANTFDKEKVRAALFELALAKQIKGVPITHERILEKLLPLLDSSGTLTDTITLRLKRFGPVEQSLKSIMLDEMSKNALETQKEFHPAAKELLYLLFPNGKNDLTFVPPALQKQTWNLLKTTLLPMALPIISKSVLSPQFINDAVLGILNKVEAKLAKGPPPFTSGTTTPKKVAEERKLTELDEAAARLMEQLLERLELPSLVKNKIWDENHTIRPEMKFVLGDALKGTFNGSFIKTTLTNALESVSAGKDQIGKPAKPVAPATQKDIQKAARALANTGLSYAIDTWWNNAQGEWDLAIEKMFGKVGGGVKKLFDAIFRLIFFTIIGNILKVLFRPLIRASIHSFLSINKNMDSLLEPFNKMPKDQSPLTTHVMYNEDLLYKLIDGLREGVKEVMQADSEDILNTPD